MKGIRGCLLILSASALAIGWWSGLTLAQTAEELFAQAYQAWPQVDAPQPGDEAKGDIQKALSAYRRAVELKPDYVEAHNNLGVVLLTLGQAKAAAQECRRAIELKPDYALAHNNLGTALWAQGQREEALRAYRRAIELDNDARAAAFAQNNLGLILLEQGKVDEALAAFRAATQKYPQFPAAHFNQGVALAQKGQFREAATAYRQAIQADPNYAPAHLNLGVVLAEQGRVDEAVEAYRKAAELAPDNPLVHYNLGFALRQRERYEEAIAAFSQYLRLESEGDRAQQVRQWVSEMEKQSPAQVTVVTVPENVKIFTTAPDQQRGQYQGRTPLTLHIPVKPGQEVKYRITLILAGYKRVDEYVNLAPGSKQRLEVTMARE